MEGLKLRANLSGGPNYYDNGRKENGHVTLQSQKDRSSIRALSHEVKKNMLDIVVIGSRRATFQHFLGSVTCQLKIFVTFQQSHPFIELHKV